MTARERWARLRARADELRAQHMREYAGLPLTLIRHAAIAAALEVYLASGPLYSSE